MARREQVDVVAQLYRHHDVDGGGFIETETAEAQRYNDNGFGIFHTVNEFNGARQISNLSRICSWAVDLDEGTKREQYERLERGPLRPSLIIETARGYHAYWAAKGADRETWEPIVKDRLVPYYQADPNARDLARVLRAPGYWHLKDPEHPFLVKIIHQEAAAYSPQMMIKLYPAQPGYYDQRRDTRKGQIPAPRPTNVLSIAKHHRETAKGGEDVWERIYQADQRRLLEGLSGRPEMNGEQITFRLNRRGGYQIIANGKVTSCWIDERGRIGSSDKGGPSVIDFLCWYGCDKGTAIRAVKEEFPEFVQ